MTSKPPQSRQTHWDAASRWYDAIVGEAGHDYHRSVILPGLMRLMGFDSSESVSSLRLLDAACGQGVLAEHLPSGVDYTGIDASKKLIGEAHKRHPHKNFQVRDLMEPLRLSSPLFDAATLLLAIQNLPEPDAPLRHIGEVLRPGARLLIAMNHPCFRIPRHSFWRDDPASGKRLREISSYLTPQEIPIATHPSRGQESPQTWTTHFPLSRYFSALQNAGFSIVTLEEWTSDKKSFGKHAGAENRARREIPLFLALLAEKRP